MTADRDDVMRRLGQLEGLHVGLLDPDELTAFNEACQRGEAYRSYVGAAGILGVAKVRLRSGLPDSGE